MATQNTSCNTTLNRALVPTSGFRALALTILLALTPQAAQTAQATEKIVICYAAVPSALIPLAKQQNYYAAEGLDVTLRRLPSGKQALEAMFAGECALAPSADIPVVHNSLSRNDFRIVAAISTYSDFEKVIVRSDRGILTPADLRGRRIAVAEFTGGHYFLDIYLTANGLTPKDVIKVYLPAQDVAPAFRRGEVDAAAHWEPTILALANEFGAKAKVFNSPGLHTSPFLLVGRQDFLSKNPATVERVMRALLRAERFVKDQPVNAKALTARDYEAAPSEVEQLWPIHTFHVALSQSIPFILENAARWEIGLLPPAQRPAVPNYLEFIYFDALQAVKPTAVTIIH